MPSALKEALKALVAAHLQVAPRSSASDDERRHNARIGISARGPTTATDDGLRNATVLNKSCLSVTWTV